MNKCHKRGTALKDLKGEALERWVAYRDNPEFKVRSDRGQRNKTKNCELERKANPTHHRGSQSSYRHAMKIQAELGRMQTAPELFLDMHAKSDDEGTTRFLTRKDQAIWDAYNNEHANLDTAPDTTQADPNKTFLKVILGYKKGSVYGVGNAHGMYFTLPPPRFGTSSQMEYTQAGSQQPDPEKKQMKEELASRREQIKKMEEQMAMFQAMFARCNQGRPPSPLNNGDPFNGDGGNSGSSASFTVN